MVHESPGQHPVPVTLPPSLDEWLAERADEAGIDRGELLVQLAATYRAAAEDGAAARGLVNAVEEAATDAATERVDDRLGSFRSSLDSQLQVIRKRVVQLKRESDEKAEASRVKELSTRLDDVDEHLGDVDEHLGDVDGRLGELEESVGALRETVEEHSESLEAIETGAGNAAADHDGHPDRGKTVADPELAERLDDFESKLVRVARAVVELRDEDRTRDDVPPRETTLRELQRAAAREGVREARCAGCGEDVDLALLPDAVCPHCDARFADLTVDEVFEEPCLGVEADGEEQAGGDGEHGTGTPEAAADGTGTTDADADAEVETGSR